MRYMGYIVNYAPNITNIGLIADLSIYVTTEEISPTARAVVARPRDCTMCRECVRHTDEGWDQRVQVGSSFFYFSIF